MSNEEKFDAPDADVILQALGPPECDFRVHKLVLSLASPVFKDMFSLPQPVKPTPDNSKASSVEKIDIVSVTDPPHALKLVLRMIYPFKPPSFDGTLKTLVECLGIAEKYGMEGPKEKLRVLLSRAPASHILQAYAIASRFGFTDIAETASRQISSSINLAGISQLPDEFEFVPPATYHALVRQRAQYLEEAADIIKRIPFMTTCSSCPGGRFAGEVFRLGLTNLIMKGTPLEARACLNAWVNAHGSNGQCKEDCAAKFIRAAISGISKRSNNLIVPPSKPVIQRT
jgi:hypothetical protein